MIGPQQSPKLRPVPHGHGEVAVRTADSVGVELTNRNKGDDAENGEAPKLLFKWIFGASFVKYI
jgi:hypothetical protein